MFETIVITPASDEPVSLAEAKAQLRLEPDFTLDDAYIQALISAARDRAEKYCNRFFTEQIVRVIYNDPLPMGEIVLPYPDLQSVDALQYGKNSTIETIDAADYFVDLERQRIILTGAVPVTDNYRLTLTTDAPKELSGVKQAILMMVADLYELRTESTLVAGATVTNNPALKAMLYPYREWMGI